MQTKEQSQVERNRLKELKQLKQLANAYLHFYIKRQQHPQKDWESDLSNRNIAMLKATLNKLNKLQHDDKISEYLEAIRQYPPLSPDATEKEKEDAFQKLSEKFATVFSQSGNLFLLMEINSCSPRLSYFNDLTWFRHGDIQEHLDYGMGKIDETVFEKYLPYQIDRIIETKQSFFSKNIFIDDLILLEASLRLIEEEKYIPSNILIITLIEGLVRKFALLVYKKQNPNCTDKEIEDFAYMRNRSLEALIKNKAWKKDIPLPYSAFTFDYAHTDSPIVNDFEQKFKKHKEANIRIDKKLSEFHKIFTDHVENSVLSDEELRVIGLKYLDGLKDESAYLMH